MTTEIADAIEEALAPQGVLVVVEAEHLCMSMRGVKKSGTSTVTSAVRGLFRNDAGHPDGGHGSSSAAADRASGAGRGPRGLVYAVASCPARAARTAPW